MFKYMTKAIFEQKYALLM